MKLKAKHQGGGGAEEKVAGLKLSFRREEHKRNQKKEPKKRENEALNNRCADLEVLPLAAEERSDV